MIKPEQITFFNFEITSFCNLHCPQCSRFDAKGFENRYMNQKHWDFEKLLPNLELSKLTNLKDVLLQGDYGDPLMHPRVFDILDAFSHIERIKIGTNASLLNKDRWRRLAGYHNLTVTFAVDGLSDTNSIYRINSDFDKIMNNARTFIEAGGRAIWKFIAFKHNEHQIEQAREMANKMGFADFLVRYSNRNFFEQDSVPVMIDGVYQNYDLHMATGLQTRQDTKHVMIRNLDQFNGDTSCPWLKRYNMYVDHLGNLIPCCMTSGLMWRKDMSGKLWQRIVGDLDSLSLYNHTITDILESDFYQHRLQESLSSIKTIHHACFSNCKVAGT